MATGALRLGLNRRQFLKGAGAGAVGVFGVPAFLRSVGVEAAATRSSLFPLGVASGDPSADSVVLWTRLAPEPLTGGGLGARVVPVSFVVATDPGLSDVIASGVRAAIPERGHCVHATVTGLPSNRWLYYRFSALGEQSRVGRTRTFPRVGEDCPRMRFALASCQDMRTGYFSAYADMLEQELDCVIHVGDYIYEDGPEAQPFDPARNHLGGETFSLLDYRSRYAHYRLDPDLQEAHARFPFIVTPDDHEVDNNYAGVHAEEGAAASGAAFRERRQNALRAYVEAMPLRAAQRRTRSDGSVQLFRTLEFGDLASFHVLDTRQFRSDQPARDGFGSSDPASWIIEPVFAERIFDRNGLLSREQTVLGQRQLERLESSLRSSRGTWNVLAQQIMMTRWNLVDSARFTVLEDPAVPESLKPALAAQIEKVDHVYNVDAWDGAPRARDRLVKLLQRSGARNPIVLSGDIHAAWGSHILSDFDDPESPTVAAEFVCTSISSAFGGIDPRTAHRGVRASLDRHNSHVTYFNGLYRGYCICELDHQRWRTSYRALGTPEDAERNDRYALVPRTGTTATTDISLEIAAGFHTRRGEARLESRNRRRMPY